MIVDRSQQAGSYVIRVQGALDAHWARWFDGLTLSADEAETTISGPIRDLAELHGLLTKINDLGLTLLEVRRIGAGHTTEERRSR